MKSDLTTSNYSSIEFVPFFGMMIWDTGTAFFETCKNHVNSLMKSTPVAGVHGARAVHQEEKRNHLGGHSSEWMMVIS